jgi:hypothetical protein
VTEDITRHRRPGQSLPGRLGVGVLILAALAVGGVVNSRTPDTDHRERPFVATGTIGRAVDVRTFEATVLGVRGTTKLAYSGEWHDTSGIWILVRLRLAARDKPASIGYAAVRDSKDRTYLATTRISQPLLSRVCQPGIPVEGEVAFEVPPAVAPTLSIRLADPVLDQRLDAMAEVPLRITKSKVDQWRSDGAITKISDTEAV